MSEPKTMLTTGQPVTDDHREIDSRTGMQKGYVVLTPDERSKGFVRPVRVSYRHVGPAGPKFPLRDLDAEEELRYRPFKYVKYEEYPEGYKGSVTGRYWTQAQLDHKGCGEVTTMGQGLAETYARDPKFYSGTFCATCKKHFPVGEDGEFEWLDGTKVGT